MASSRDYEDPISARLENHISTGVSAPTGFEIQFIEAVNNNGETPFFIACANGHLDVVQYLCNLKNINTKTPDNNGITPFQAARKNGYTNITNYLSKRNKSNKKH